MKFDQFTVVLIELRDDAPQLDEAAAARLQDGHLTHLAELHEAGHLLAAGPFTGEREGRYLGLVIMSADAERAIELLAMDPAAAAGRHVYKVLPWMVPGGAMSFSRTRFPRSMAEAFGDGA